MSQRFMAKPFITKEEYKANLVRAVIFMIVAVGIFVAAILLKSNAMGGFLLGLSSVIFIISVLLAGYYVINGRENTFVADEKEYIEFSEDRFIYTERVKKAAKLTEYNYYEILYKDVKSSQFIKNGTHGIRFRVKFNEELSGSKIETKRKNKSALDVLTLYYDELFLQHIMKSSYLKTKLKLQK